jgi:CNT family concentrative nucleoside transporter
MSSTSNPPPANTVTAVAAPPSAAAPAAMPRWWRLALGTLALALGAAAWQLGDVIGPRGQAAFGFVIFLVVVAGCSRNLRAVNWWTIFWGIALQLCLALFVLKLSFTIDGRDYTGYQLFANIGAAISKFLEFTKAGSHFVFGPLANPKLMEQAFPRNGFVFAFSALPTIIFASSFFTILFYLGVLQVIVRLLSRGMMWLMRTSGAETLSAVANVFLGQTEAPLIVKPYVEKMTHSELLALMAGGMATISGGIMAVYIGMGADPVAILATSVMAAPGGLYLAKLLYPETGAPQTLGKTHAKVQVAHRNVIDAAAGGATDGMALAVNVAAMLIAFLALLAMIDFLLGEAYLFVQGPHYLNQLLQRIGWDEYQAWKTVSLDRIFGVVFAPLAYLIGIARDDLTKVGDLLGLKLAANEFVAYTKLTTVYRHEISERSRILATYALTGFANFASVGIQLGGIGALAPARRGDLAQLGMKALFVGFLATLLNAALAGMLLG